MSEMRPCLSDELIGKLKPCPHCKENNLLIVGRIGFYSSIECQKCGLRGPRILNDEKPDELINTWNALSKN